MTDDYKPQPDQLSIAADVAMARLRKRGCQVRWIGLHKYMIDGKRMSLLELLEAAKEQPHD